MTWYQDGLKFACTQCGKCCTGAPGYTWVSLEEIEGMASHLKLTVEDFAARYLRKVGPRWSLREDSRSYDCIFLKDQRCSVYEVRPKQCRTFPWWAANLSSREAWEEAATRCEGIREEAPLVSLETIQEGLNGSSN